MSPLPLIPVLPIAANMESILRGMEQGVLLAKLSPVTDVATSLAAACTAISLIGLGTRFLKGSDFDWWNFLRPIVLFILTANFSTFVLGPIRGIAGVYNTRLAAAVGGSTESFKAVFREKAEDMCHREFGYGADEDTYEIREEDNGLVRFLKRTGNKVVKSFFRINEKMNLGASVIVSGVLFFLMDLSVSVMVIIANIYLVVMALIGPFTFAISILGAFPGGVKLWVERYIQYTLWQPLLYIVMYIGTEVMVLGNQAATWGGFWTWIFLCIAVFVAIRQVPAFASFIIESAGTEALANQMSGIGSQVLQKASSAAMLFR